MRTKKGSERKPRQRWHERTADKDIRYRGPLNYQHFQILGWLCIAATQLVLILGLANKMNMLPDCYAGLQEPAQIMSWLALPSVLYNPDNPAVAHDGGSIGLYLMIAGAVILAVTAFSAIKEKQS